MQRQCIYGDSDVHLQCVPNYVAAPTSPKTANNRLRIECETGRLIDRDSLLKSSESIELLSHCRFCPVPLFLQAPSVR